MRFNKLLFIPLLSLTALTSSCSSENKNYTYDDYVAGTLQYKEDFKIVQFTDIHIANKDYQDEQFAFMTLTMNDTIINKSEAEQADLIVVTGDLFTFADKKTATRLLDYLDSFGKPWTVTFGNHDEQCYFSVDWLTSQLNHYGSHCIFKDLQDDNVFGNANFVINLTDDGTKNGKVEEQIIVLDSNRYNYGEYIGYDYIHEDQVQWYEMMVNETTKRNGGSIVPSLAFFHIPFEEYSLAYDAAEKGEATFYGDDSFRGEKNESVSCPKKNTGLFSKMKELGSTKGCFVGHDHINSYAVNYQGILLCYGINSTNRIYYKDNIMGGQVISYNVSSGTFTIDRYFHTYAEVR